MIMNQHEPAAAATVAADCAQAAVVHDQLNGIMHLRCMQLNTTHLMVDESISAEVVREISGLWGLPINHLSGSPAPATAS